MRNLFDRVTVFDMTLISTIFLYFVYAFGFGITAFLMLASFGLVPVFGPVALFLLPLSVVTLGLTMWAAEEVSYHIQ